MRETKCGETGVVLWIVIAVLFVSLGVVTAPRVGASPGGTRYLVVGAAGCDKAHIATDADCWSLTSGGSGGAGVAAIVGGFAVLAWATGWIVI